MTEPTRPLPYPTLNADGRWEGRSQTSPEAITIRGLLSIPPSRVIPVIVVPGIMGTNLRATTDPNQEQNRELAPGEPAWRPPNGRVEGWTEVGKWKERTPKQRQRILDPATLEVDGGGEIAPSDLALSGGCDDAMARSRGWGEVHWDSYGKLIRTLEHNLNRTFLQLHAHGGQQMQPHWKAINAWNRKDWSLSITELTAPLTQAEFEKHARFYYPVYACGYNWLLSNEQSARRLQQRIEEIIHFWASRKQDCKQVILVTHSMGGLVARACARQITEKIVGVIHGVMPAHGAPVSYRRIACGTESSNSSMGLKDSINAWGFATIAGKTSAETTPVLATAPGPLELLPNHLYARPWLFVTTKREHAADTDLLRLPMGNPYDLYRDTNSWYRMIDPSLVDPADKYKGKSLPAVIDAINQAEIFHTRILDNYYHPDTYAFYGGDHAKLSFGCIRWLSADSPPSLSQELVKTAKFEGATFNGGRNITYFGRGKGFFELVAEPESAGDGIVPEQSGCGPAGKVKQLFHTQGYGHADCYQDDATLALIQHLIAKIVQAIP